MIPRPTTTLLVSAAFGASAVVACTRTPAATSLGARVSADASPGAALGADGRLVYDSALQVYWLADADLAATQTFGVDSIDPDGSMSWNTAQNWVAAMNAANYLGHSDWRLPLTGQPDPGCTQQTPLGSFAYNCTGSEMGELFYHALGGSKGSSIASLGGPAHRFRHFQPYLYWSGTVYPVVGKSSWSFSFGNGFEGTNLNVNAMYAIPLFPVVNTPASPPPPNIGIGVVPAVNASPSLAPSADERVVYDPALNVTWLADGDLAARRTFGVTGINPDGSMNWNTAQAWITAMNDSNYLGHNGWRLPKTRQPDTTCSIETPVTHDFSGYDCTGSEMGELFYTELGGAAGSTLRRTHDGDAELFHNVQPSLYWSDADTSQAFGAWTFSFGNGFQGANFFANDLYVIPVIDGPIGCTTCAPGPEGR